MRRKNTECDCFSGKKAYVKALSREFSQANYFLRISYIWNDGDSLNKCYLKLAFQLRTHPKDSFLGRWDNVG